MTPISASHLKCSLFFGNTGQGLFCYEVTWYSTSGRLLSPGNKRRVLRSSAGREGRCRSCGLGRVSYIIHGLDWPHFALRHSLLVRRPGHPCSRHMSPVFIPLTYIYPR